MRKKKICAALLCLTALTGCGGSPAAPAPLAQLASEPPLASTGSAPTTTPRPYVTTTPTLELGDRTTKPGTKLKFGQQAVVPFYSEYAKGLLGLTLRVDSAPAPDSDIDAMPLSDKDKAKIRGKTFYFLRITMTDVDGANFDDVWAPTFSARTRSGGWPGQLLGAGASVDVTGCDGVSSAPTDFSTPGAVFEQCQLYIGLASDPVTSVEYASAPYDHPDSAKLTWRK